MKEGNNNLMKGFERLSKLMEYVQSLNGQVSIIERDLLLQEVRELYVEILSMDVTVMQPVSTHSNGDTEEVVAFENIMQTMPSMEQEERHEEQKEVEVEPMAKREQVEEVAPKQTYEKPKVVVKVEAEEQEESPFAPAEPEPEVVAPEHVMEKVEGDKYEELFEEAPKHETIKHEASKHETVRHEEPKHEEMKHEEMKHEEPKHKEVKHEEIKHEEPKHEEVKYEEVKHEEPHKEHKVEQPSLFDYLSQAVPTVAEKPAPKTIADKLGFNRQDLETQLEQKVNKHKVKDLRTVININDKFSFMTELFHNNMRAYNDFILKLNDIDMKDEALRYVEKVSKDFNWDEHSLSVKTFYKILERKF